MLPILPVTLEKPTLVLRNKVGNISPLYNNSNHVEPVMHRRPICANATPAIKFAENKNNFYAVPVHL